MIRARSEVRVGPRRLLGFQVVNNRLITDLWRMTWPMLSEGELAQSHITGLVWIPRYSPASRKGP